MTPFMMHFDRGACCLHEPDVVHVPPIDIGAPYDQELRLRLSDGSYVDFTGYDDVLMQIRTRAAGPVLVTMRMSDGHFALTDISLSLRFPAAKTAEISGYFSGSSFPAIRFVHDIILIESGEVSRVFARGNGLAMASISTVIP